KTAGGVVHPNPRVEVALDALGADAPGQGAADTAADVVGRIRMHLRSREWGQRLVGIKRWCCRRLLSLWELRDHESARLHVELFCLSPTRPVRRRKDTPWRDPDRSRPVALVVCFGSVPPCAKHPAPRRGFK